MKRWSLGTPATPIPPHVAGDFYLWLWWQSEELEGAFDLGGRVGRFDLWVEDRITFRNAGEDKIAAAVFGDMASESREARASLRSGKRINDLRLHLRRDDRDFVATLRGPQIDVFSAVLPFIVNHPDVASTYYDRLFLYEELQFVIGHLFEAYARSRTSEEWTTNHLPALRAWVHTQGNPND